MKYVDGAFTYNWVRLHNETLILSPYRWSKQRYMYALTALFSNTLQQFNNLVNQGYEDARRNDSYFHYLTKKIRNQEIIHL